LIDGINFNFEADGGRIKIFEDFIRERNIFMNDFFQLFNATEGLFNSLSN